MKDTDIASFVIIDQYLIRGLLYSHSKTPLEHLYLETGALPVKYIIMSRRLIYLKEIIDRPDNEIINKVYKCQRAKPDPEDWCNSIDQDLKDIELQISDETTKSMSALDYKKLIKTSVRNAAFYELHTLKESHTKVEHNIYTDMNRPQGYLTKESITNVQCSILFALRSHSLRGVKENFQNTYSQNSLCPICERFSDSQDHILQCKVLQDICPLEEQVEYNSIYGTTHEQEELVKVYEKYLSLRDELLEDTAQQSLPGLYTGPQRQQARTTSTRTSCSSSGI